MLVLPFPMLPITILGDGEYVRVRVKSSRKEDMSSEGLGCLESLVPSKPSEPTLTSNQRLRLHHSSLVLKTENSALASLDVFAWVLAPASRLDLRSRPT